MGENVIETIGEVTYNKVSWNLPPFSTTSKLQWPLARVKRVIDLALKFRRSLRWIILSYKCFL
jgi:hypothetical protein